MKRRSKRRRRGGHHGPVTQPETSKSKRYTEVRKEKSLKAKDRIIQAKKSRQEIRQTKARHS